MKTCIRFFAAATMAVMATAAGAVELALWNSQGVENPLAGSFTPTAIADGLTVNNLTAGSGLLLSGNSAALNMFSAGGYDMASATTAMSSNDWWETCLDAGANELALECLKYSFRASGSGPKYAQWSWSTNRANWNYLGAPEPLDQNFVERTPVDLSGVPGANRVWLRLVAWNGGAANNAWGGFGRATNVLKIYGEVLASDAEPTVGFSPASPLAYVEEPLTIEVRARPAGTEVTSITVNPLPEGIVTPNLREGTWTFVPTHADFRKMFTVSATVSNEYGEASGSVDLHVNGTLAEENGVSWRFCIVGENAMVTGAFPTEGEVIIPSSLEGYPVTSIGERAFANCSGLTSLTIPDSVTNLASNAFADCSELTCVTVPQPVCDQRVANVFPASYQFLTNVTIETTVTHIGDNVFSGCSALTSVKIPDSVTSIGSSVFSGCNGLYDTNTIPGVRLVDGWAVGQTDSLSGVLDLTGIRGIAASAFLGCNALTGVTIPDSVKSIGGEAFGNCSGLTNVTILGNVTNDWTLRHSPFSNCTNLVALVLSEKMTKIGNYMFSGCSGLTSVKIPYGVTSIGREAFRDCSGLTSVLISNSVTNIGTFAFSGCSGLTSVTIPDSVTGIDAQAFSRCSGLTSVTIPSSVTNIAVGAFYGCSGLTAFHVSTGNLFYAALDGVLFSKDGQTLVCFPCCKTETYVIPDSVTSIEDAAFSGCSGLMSVTIPNSVTTIGEEAFAGCSGLSNMIIPSSVTNIGGYVFSSCRGLTSVTIPDSVTNLRSGAFWGCYNLTSVTLPESVTSIGGYSFYGCSNLTSVTIPNSITNIGSMAFRNCRNLTRVTIPDCVTSIGMEAFWNCRSLTNVTIGNGVTIIGEWAFGYCRGLTNVRIPVSVVSIGTNAFYGCSAMETLWVPASWEGMAMLADTAVPDSCMVCYYDSNADEHETMTTPVPVPHDWLEENAAELLAANTNDYETTAAGPAANGHPVWECYLAGLSTTNAAAVFQMKSISFEDGKLVLKWDPDLNAGGEKTNRVYVVEGTESLDGTWGETNAASRFFRVKVEMPKVGD